MPDHVHLIAQPLDKPSEGIRSLSNTDLGTAVRPSSRRQDARTGHAGDRVASPCRRSELVCWDLSAILHSVKSFSAKVINRIEGTCGLPVWQTECYDRIIRDEQEFVARLTYLCNNPARSGLIEQAEEYPWLWVAEGLLSRSE